jgi:hypothetical protein
MDADSEKHDVEVTRRSATGRLVGSFSDSRFRVHPRLVFFATTVAVLL